MHAIAYSILKDYADAEDAAAESFVKAWEKLEQLRETEKAKAWLFSIAHNTAVDHYRKKRQMNNRARELQESFVPDKGPDPSASIMCSEYDNAARRVLSEMRPSYSEILQLSVVYYMTPAEVRSALGINEKLRSVRLCRAKKEFRKKLSEMKETEDFFGEYMV